MNINKMQRKKARWELHKAAAHCLVVTLQKTTAVQSPASHLTNQTCSTLLEKLQRIHKRDSLMDSDTWTCSG